MNFFDVVAIDFAFGVAVLCFLSVCVCVLFANCCWKHVVGINNCVASCEFSYHSNVASG